ncbi:hypothetical protein HXX76_012066 [Chlamydomonas incerta]|uniref:CBS domain-containing protein n=1 Tax=Chlamydomonas incerta TaxID=51695 RepID=A0A835SLG1_CHLIN|nr:hypothetical protein HXX76_012066 [Chlamydomonas incerta]|eukprot:KAG2427741.1 hypothetical protein HXX76_012066 [Chlamydomonas incerta]
MAPVDGSPGLFAVVVHLPPGYHQYKFIVDGRWRHDETAPFMPDPLGNVNNWLFVRRIDPSPTPLANNLAFDPQQLVAAQQAAALQVAQQQAAAAQQQAAAQQLQQLHPALASASLAPASGVSGGVQVGVPAQTLATGIGVGGLGQLSHAQQQQQPHSGPLNAAVGLIPGLTQQQHPAAQQQHQQPGPHPGGVPVGSGLQPPAAAQVAPQQGDVDMGGTEAAVVPPIVIHNPKEPEYTRKKIADFLHSHTAYELIPESGKVVVLDVDLPVRQAFHALHEQGTASAPLWDSSTRSIPGVISASDFITILRRLRHSVSAGANPLSEAEMDAHTIRGLREEAATEGREPKGLVYVMADEDLAKVVARLAQYKCSMAPVLSSDPGGPEQPPHVLHLATLSGVLACLMRHFRASLASLPLLSQPLGSLPLGTWSPDAAVAHTDFLPDSKERRQWRKLQPLHTVTVSTPLTTALAMLLETGVSALPVVDDKRCLVDCYARSQITDLCKGGAYNRLQWEDVTVGQGLALANNSPQPWSQSGAGSASQSALGNPAPQPQQLAQPGMGGLSAEFAAAAAAAAAGGQSHHGSASSPHVAGLGLGLGAGSITAQSGGRVWVVTKDDTLRTVVERLAVPGVRRLIVVTPESRRVEGIISLSDVAQYLFL